MVSVIIDNYNYDKYITEAIESVLFQTYKDWELIIIDDGSADSSMDIIRRYDSLYPDKIQFVAKENGGQASCFNRGFEKSTGDIIAFLDSDDFIEPNMYQELYNSAKLNNTDITMCAAVQFDDLNKKIVVYPLSVSSSMILLYGEASTKNGIRTVGTCFSSTPRASAVFALEKLNAVSLE